MLKKTITFVDYNDKEQTKDFYFNLTKAEIMKMEMSTEGGLAEKIQKITEAKDVPAIISVFEEVIQKSYGVKTPEGGFVKRPADLEEFMASPAYSELFMELATDADAAAAFINGVVPKDMNGAVAPKAVK